MLLYRNILFQTIVSSAKQYDLMQLKLKN